jgi:hypothetical protein
MSHRAITVVAVEALSYSGTTWLNLVLGSHAKAFTLGPPDRVWRLRNDGFRGANLVWKDQDTFWKGFNDYWDRKENFLIALADYGQVTHIIMDGPSEGFSSEVMNDPQLEIKRPLYLRDARAITASFARKNPTLSYLESILPSGWFYHSYQALRLTDGNEPRQVYYYEDCVAEPVKFLERIGPYIGLKYTSDALRFWEYDHHITSGNQGTLALLRLAKGLPVNDFEGHDFYRKQLERLQENYLHGFIDERWKTELSRLDRFYFDVVLGAKHEELGYDRDRFEFDEIRALLEEHKARVRAGKSIAIPRRYVDLYLEEHGLADKSFMRELSKRIRANITAARTCQLTKFLGIKGNGSKAKALKSRTFSAVGASFHALKRFLGPHPNKVFRALGQSEAMGSTTSGPWPSTTLPGVTYLASHEKARINKLRDYKTSATSKTLESIKADINQNFYLAYGPDFLALGPQQKVCVDTLVRYRDLLEFLREIPNLEFLTARELDKAKPVGNQILIQVRHDVDGDLVSALLQARMENQLSVRSTFYILHTAPYYGQWSSVKGRFERNEAALEVYLEIQLLGHEVALHTDPLWLYQEHNVNGAQALQEEIAWLRGNGLRIVGTAAHNSVGTYGAVNYAIFTGRNLAFNEPAGPLGVIKDGKWAPLQVISERELGLEYEGNDLFWQTHTRLEYYCLISQNLWFHQVFDEGSIRAKNEKQKRTEWKTQEQVLEEIANLEGPCNLMLSVHPMHYGFRASSTDVPQILAPNEASTLALRPGWRLYPDGETIIARAGEGNRVEFDAISVANSLGQLDMPLQCIAEHPTRILFLGRDMLASPSVAVASKASQVTAALLNRAGCKVAATSTGQCPSTPSVQIASLHRARQELEFEMIVFSVGADDIIGCDPSMFSAVMGLANQERDLLFDTPWSAECFKAIDGLLSTAKQPDISPYASAVARDFFFPGEESCAEFNDLWQAAEERLFAAIQHIQQLGYGAVLLIEECGEKAGLWTAHTDHETRIRLANMAEQRFIRLAARAGTAIVNPYLSFNANAGRFSTHWLSVSQWSIHGHYLAARSIADVIEPLLAEAADDDCHVGSPISNAT